MKFIEKFYILNTVPHLFFQSDSIKVFEIMSDPITVIKISSWINWYGIPAALIAVILYILHYMQTRSHKALLGNKIPGPPTVPILGNALELIGIRDNMEVFDRAYQYQKLYGGVIRGWVGPKLVIFLSDARDAEVILNSNVHIDKSVEYKFFKPWLGNGLLISSGDTWRNHRKLIAPAFHQNVLKTFVDLFNKNSLEVVNRMKKEAGKEFDVHEYMSETTVDILLETAMGSKKTSESKKGFDYAMAVMRCVRKKRKVSLR